MIDKSYIKNIYASIKSRAFNSKLFDRARSAVLKHLPVPLYLGVEESKDAVKFALIRRDAPDNATLIDYAIIPLSEKKTSARPDPLSVVRNILQEKKLYTATVAKVAVSGPGVDSKRLRLPSMPKDEVSKALKWEAKEHFLFDVENSMLDFDILDEKVSQSGEKSMDLIATLAQKELVEKKISLVKDTDIPPVVITSVGYSLYNLYKLTADKSKQAPVAVIDIGSSTTTIVVIEADRVRFIRQLGCSGSDLTKAMTGTLASDAGKIDLSPEDAEALKIDTGIPDDALLKVRDGITGQQIISLLRPAIERIAEDIKMSLEYYSSTFDEAPVSKILLTGGTSKLKNINSELYKRLSIPVESLQLPEGLKLQLDPPKASGLKDAFPLIAPSIGAALSNIDKVNLIPPAYRRHRIKKIEEFSLRAVFIIISLVLAASYMFNSARENILRRQLNARTPQREKLIEFQNLHSKVTQKNLIINQTVTNQVQLYYIFKALTNLTPKAINLVSIIISDNAGAMSIEGVALERGEMGEIILTEFISVLEDAPYFSNVRLVSSDDIEVSGKKALEFEINCKL